MGTRKTREISRSSGEPALLSTAYDLRIVADTKMDKASWSRECGRWALEGYNGASKAGWSGGLGEKEGLLEEVTRDLGSHSSSAV